ncbi:MAG TPA: protoheme IX farnesyltransferase [Saprospiraceae bacterium]|nr:protoheme IX farnesyltransferase [Saprospiraceae bacterium]
MGQVKTNSFALAKLYIQDFVELTKFRLGALVIFSSLVSLYVVSNGQAVLTTYLLLGLGGFLVSGGASALNEVFEKDYDAMMERTKNRPIPAGRMSSAEGLFYAGLMSLGGISLLALINPLTAFLSTLSLILYAFVYTPFKRFSNIAVLIGAIPGAFPLLIGGVAFHGFISVDAIYLFGMQFFWQFGHFWAIAWIGDKDYKKAGYLLLPFDGEKNKNVGLISMWTCVPLIVLSVMPFVTRLNSVVALLIVVLSGGFFLYRSYELYRDSDDQSARRLMYASFIYLPTVLLAYSLNV